MKVSGSTALVTGANRGIGLAFAQELLNRGAKRVYAAARDPSSVDVDGADALRLDVTKPEEITAAAVLAKDVTLVINNAGVVSFGGFLVDGSEETARRMLEVNYFGVLRVSRAFAPVLASNGGGALLNVLSIGSFINAGLLAPYAASKSAAWSLTNSLRYELAAQKTQVLALHMSFVDTDMVRTVDGPKMTTADVVRLALDGLESDLDEVLADEKTRVARQGLTAPRPVYLPPLK